MSLSTSTTIVLAHGIGGRSDLPIPLWLAMYAGGVAVIASFLILAGLWSTPKLGDPDAGRPFPALQTITDARATRIVLQVLGLLLAAAFLVVAWLGPDDNGRHNPAPYWFYVWFWVGIVPASLAFGPVWRLLNPLRTLAALIRALLRIKPRPVPERFGYWPAVISLLAFLWLELVNDHASSPRAVALFVTSYGVVHLIAGTIYGSAWFARGDGFEVYSWLVSRAAPLSKRPDGRLVLRNPFDGLSTTPRSPGITPVVVVMLGSTVFDGLSRTPLWAPLVAGTSRPAYLALGTIGLAFAISAVALTYSLAIRLTRPFLHPGNDVYGEFAHTLIPIAIGYTVAHYFSFALFQGQKGILLTNDPLVIGQNLLDLANAHINYTVMSSTVIALVQVAAIVVGHIFAVIAAHDRAVAVLPRRHARSGQYPMLVLMVAYTTAGIALLAGA